MQNNAQICACDLLDKILAHSALKKVSLPFDHREELMNSILLDIMCLK